MMKRDLRRFAPIGLYLAGLAAVATAGLYIVQHNFALPIQICLALVVVGLGLSILMDPQRAMQTMTGRQARYGSNALLLSIAFIGIVVVINFVVSSHSKQWDLTEDKTNSLTSETIKTLESLKEPVKAEAFYTPRVDSSTANNLLTNYKAKSNGKFDFQFINPEANPVLAQQAKVTRDGTIVLMMQDRQEQVTFASEQDLTGALVRLANPGKRVIYFLTGHGEYVMDSTSSNNYAQVKSSLTSKNYTVNTLNLLATPKIPDDALAIVVAGATKPLSDQEVNLIKTYQEKGGCLVYLAEPTAVTDFQGQSDPMAKYLDETWGIKLDDDLVVDPTSSQPLVAISQQFQSHAITDKMYSKAIVLPSARSLQVDKAPTGVTLTPLAQTSNLAWGVTDVKAFQAQAQQSQQIKPDASKDLLGPLTLAIAGENSTTKARVFVVGDSDFAGSQGFTQYGNSDFILNGIDWTAVQDNLISLTPRQPVQRFIAPPQQYTMGLILLGSIFLMPAVIVLTGVTVWVQRRRRG